MSARIAVAWARSSKFDDEILLSEIGFGVTESDDDTVSAVQMDAAVGMIPQPAGGT
jgi:hypothetical protein